MSMTSTSSPQPSPFGSPPITLILTMILLICLLLGLFSIYFCRCFLDSIVNSWNLWRTPSGYLINNSNHDLHRVSSGLDPLLIQEFPTFMHGSVRDLHREKYGLECAICLGEFHDVDMLRLLTVCYHVFHQECVDLWLGSHKTCPFCRHDLDLPRETLQKKLALEITSNDNNDNNVADDNIHSSNTGVPSEHVISISLNKIANCDNINNNNIGVLPEHAFSIHIRDEEGSREGNGEEKARNESLKKGNRRCEKMERFSRSNSTGHSIMVRRRDYEEEDRYCSKLKEHVKVKIITRGHATIGSCITFGDFSSPTTSRFGEVSGCSVE